MLNKKRIKYFLLVLIIITGNYFANENSLKFESNIEKAFENAKAEGKYVLVYFSGSDWCRPCMQLHLEVFESEQFLDFAKLNLLIVRLDFPSKDENKLSEEQFEYNNKMAQTLNKKGVFPYLILYDSAQNELLDIAGYNRSGPEEIIKLLKSKM